MEILKEKENLILKYNIYKGLLTQTQIEYFEMSLINDYSIGEIAEIYKVSRNAVFDTIKQVKEKLESFEKSLGFVEKTLRQRDLIEKLETEKDHTKIRELLKELKETL